MRHYLSLSMYVCSLETKMLIKWQKKNDDIGDGKVSQQVMAFATQSGSRSVIPRAYVKAEGESRLHES